MFACALCIDKQHVCTHTQSHATNAIAIAHTHARACKHTKSTHTNTHVTRSSRRSLKPHSTRHSDRDEQRGRVSSRDKESSRHRTRHHSREHSQQMDDEGLTAAAAPEDHMPGPDQLTNTTTAHFATQQGRRHKVGLCVVLFVSDCCLI